MRITYRHSTDGITPGQLKGFFVGWPNPPSTETHLKLLRESARAILAVDEDKGAVVGFVTAVSDGVLSAFIPFLEVLPEYQKKGIGAVLMRRMLEELKDLYVVDLTCDAPLQPWYEKLGMKRATAMVARNYERQSGQ